MSRESVLFNPFATGDAYMRQLFHSLQWYAGSERVKLGQIKTMPQPRTIITIYPPCPRHYTHVYMKRQAYMHASMGQTAASQ